MRVIENLLKDVTRAYRSRKCEKNHGGGLTDKVRDGLRQGNKRHEIKMISPYLFVKV